MKIKNPYSNSTYCISVGGKRIILQPNETYTGEELKLPTIRWKEEDILKFINEQKLNIDYQPERDTKKYALDKIKEKLC